MVRIIGNPLIMMNPSFMDKDILTVDHRFFANCRELRGLIGRIVEDKRKLMDPEAGDVVSLLLQDPDYQNTEEIIDDVLVMFIAGSKTVQITTTNLITSMLHEPEVYRKMRDEIDPMLERVKDDIMGKMTLQEVDELVYMKMCYQESMRRDSPASVSMSSTVTKPCSIGGVNLTQDDLFVVFIQT